MRDPTTGIAPCCARVASGHAAAAPPSSVMNSRRLMPIMASIKVTGAANRRHSIRLRLDDEAGHAILNHLGH